MLLIPRKAWRTTQKVTKKSLFAQSLQLQRHTQPSSPLSALSWILSAALEWDHRSPGQTKRRGLKRQVGPRVKWVCVAEPPNPCATSKFRVVSCVPMLHLSSFYAVARAGSRPAFANFLVSQPLYMFKNYWGPQDAMCGGHSYWYSLYWKWKL